MQNATRRDFLGNLGHGMLVACVGPALASELSARAALPHGARVRRLPSDLERLVRAMQDTAPDALMPVLVRELKSGMALRTLVGAGALANARTFGGHDYIGYHAQMALLPAHSMSLLMPEKLRALPVLKVLYRNSARIQAAGQGRERLEPVAPSTVDGDAAQALRQHVRDRAMHEAETLFRGRCDHDVAAAYDDLQALIRDDVNVHRTVLAWRAWDMVQLLGEEHAHTMLRQCVRFCVDEEQTRVRDKRPEPAIRTVLPKVLDQHRLLDRPAGARKADDAFVDELARTVFGGSPEQAADAVAAALAEGFDPEVIGEAISLAANQLLRHDTGDKRVHGASVGVHASDAANAWRHMAAVSPERNRVASLVVGAYHTGGLSNLVGKVPYAFDEQFEALTATAPEPLLAALETAIEKRDQRAACAAVHRYGELDLPAEPVFERLLRYAVSEDGALHAEKYFHTAREEFARTRPSMRWRHIVGLARVTASEYGEPAPGHALSRELLDG